ncbi:Fic family protein [Candidatus Synechococcus spongiarum]|uniref:Fic family protein n=1 Tax=Candidatus Synechococcus spongiarum TaxID=431041 RepID=UPI001C55F2C9|nr:Fic family protein [Candidatus Synechococcus spongiarum]
MNNFQAMRWLQTLRDKTLTPKLTLSLHRRITQNTLDTGDAAGRLRRSGEDVVVDLHGEIVHRPPPAEQLEQRLVDLCAFANGDTPAAFIHPVIRAITLHFWLAYDHPFLDGNGRTARAHFYWAMLCRDYGLFSFVSISTILRKAPASYARAFRETETDNNDLTYFLLA